MIHYDHFFVVQNRDDRGDRHDYRNADAWMHGQLRPSTRTQSDRQSDRQPNGQPNGSRLSATAGNAEHIEPRAAKSTRTVNQAAGSGTNRLSTRPLASIGPSSSPLLVRTAVANNTIPS